MKKIAQNITSVNKDFERNKDLEKDKTKTTNVNILLNRVRLDQKKTFKKRIIFSLFLATVISCLTVYFII